MYDVVRDVVSSLIFSDTHIIALGLFVRSVVLKFQHP